VWLALIGVVQWQVSSLVAKLIAFGKDHVKTRCHQVHTTVTIGNDKDDTQR
jgi:hypothetical protein